MNIAVFAKKSGIGVDSLRHYERLGLLLPTRQANGYRQYDQSHLETALQIRALRDLDLPLEEIALFLRGNLSNAVLLEQHEARLMQRFIAQRQALIGLGGLLRGKRNITPIQSTAKVFPSSPILSYRALVAWNAIPAFKAHSQQAFRRLLEAQQAQPTSEEIILQHNLGFVIDQLDLEVLLPVSKALHGSLEVRAGIMPEIHCLLIPHTDDPHTALPHYRSLYRHLENQKIQIGTAMWLEQSQMLGYEIKESV